eukprot:3690566-Amphidinium_carterae.5
MAELYRPCGQNAEGLRALPTLQEGKQRMASGLHQHRQSTPHRSTCLSPKLITYGVIAGGQERHQFSSTQPVWGEPRSARRAGAVFARVHGGYAHRQ